VISQHAFHDVDQGVDERIILKWFFKKLNGGGMDRIDLNEVAGSCECGNGPSDSIKCGEFCNWLRRTLLYGVNLSGFIRT
jgi:hypothetical protein